jgi:hypothetical protein
VPSAVHAAILKRVHSGSTTIANTSGTPVTVALELPDATKAFVVCSSRSNNNSPQHQATCILSNNLLSIETGATSITASAVTVSWYVAEFESGVSVQRGTVSFAFGSASPATAPTITSVDCTKSFVVMAGMRIEAAIAANSDEVATLRALLGTVATPCSYTAPSTTSTLTIVRSDTGSSNINAAWQVVTMDGATVIGRGVVTILQASTTATGGVGTPFNPATDFILMTRAGGSAVAGVEGEYQVRVDSTSAFQLTFTRQVSNNNSNHQVDIAYEVVRLTDGGSVQKGSVTSTTTGTTMGTAGNVAAVDRSATVPFFSASGGASGTNTDFIDTMWSAAFPSTTQLQFTRGTGPGVASTAVWFAVSFYKCQNSRMCSVDATISGTSATVSWSPLYDPQCLSGSTPTACQAVVFRDKGDSASIACTPTNGTTYTVGNAPGGSCTGTTRVVFNGTGQTLTDTVTADGSKYYYRVYPRINGTTNYITDIGASLSEVSARTSASANLDWSYATTGGSTLNPPIAGNGKVYIASNAGKLIALDSATGVPVASPVITNGAVQSYVAWLPVSAGGEAVLAGDQKGWLTRMDGVTGGRVWARQLPVDSGGSIQADLSAQLLAYAQPPTQCDSGAFEAAYSLDVLYVASRNTSRTVNNVWAVPLDTDGRTALEWTFAGSPAMDRAAGQPYVDYCRNRLWVSSGSGSGGTQKSVWVINTTTGTELTSLSGLGDQTDAAPTLSFDTNTIWVGDAAGKLYAVNAAAVTPSLKYSLQLSGTSPVITGFVWQDWTTAGRLYVPVTVGGVGGVWCVHDNGTALTGCANWTNANPRLITTGAVSQPMVTDTAIFFPGADGKIYQVNTSDGLLYQGDGKPFTVETGVALGGLSTEDLTQLYVGTSTGRSYRINLVGGNLP